MQFHVSDEMCISRERLLAGLTFVLFDTGMSDKMRCETRFVRETLLTKATIKWPVVHVDPSVSHQMAGCLKCLIAKATLISTAALVLLHNVFGKHRLSIVCPFAELANGLSYTSVYTQVTI